MLVIVQVRRLITGLRRWGGGGGWGRGSGHDIRCHGERRGAGPGAAALTGAGTELIVVTALNMGLYGAKLFEPSSTVSAGNVVTLAGPTWAGLVVADNPCNTPLSKIANEDICVK